MAITGTFYRYSNPLTSIRGLVAVPNASGIALPAWLFNSATQFTSGGSIQQTGMTGLVEFGTVGAAPASGGGTYLALYSGQVDLLTAGGTLSTVVSGVSGITLFTGAVGLGTSFYGINSSGQTFHLVGSGWSQIGTMANSSYGLMANSSTLYTLQTALGRLGTMTSGGVSGSLATPMTTPTVMAGSSGVNIAVGGWNVSTLASGFSAIATEPLASGTFIGATPSASGLSVWTNNASGAFVFNQFVSGAGDTVSVAWSQNNAQILGADTNAGVVRAFTSSFGTISLSQSISLTGAAAVAIALDSQHALVCQPTQNLVTELVFSSTWATSGSLNIANPKSVLALSTTTALVGCSSGIAALTLGASGWSVTGVSALTWTPTYLAFDPATSGIAAVGVNGATGFVYFNGASGSYIGGASGCTAQQGQVAVADPTNSLIRIFANIAGTMTQENSVSGLAGVNLLANVGTYVFETNGTTTQQLVWGAPYVLNNFKSGQVSLYNGSSFTTTTLGPGHTPMALVFDASNNIDCVTQQNEIFVIAASGGVIASGSIPLFIGQNQATPYGWSSLLWASGNLYATSSMNESFAQVSGMPL